MAIENESNQMVLFLNLADLFLRNQEVEKIEKNWSFTTTDEGFLEKLRISLGSDTIVGWKKEF